MTSVDWILLGLLLLSTVVGLVRGLVFEVLSLLGWVASFFIAQWLAPLLGRHLPVEGLSDPVRYAAAFALTFVVAVMVAGLLAALMRKLLAVVGLRPVDRLLGGAQERALYSLDEDIPLDALLLLEVLDHRDKFGVHGSIRNGCIPGTKKVGCEPTFE